MNGNAPGIQIIAPFTPAFDWMKTMLFAPFDVGRWFIIAFAAFLSGNWGSSFSFRYGRTWPGGDWKYRFTKTGDLPGGFDFEPWLLGLLGGIVLFAIVLGVVWMWISSRGRFIFTDCVVRNRAAIAEPWHEYRREGNSYFFFSLAVAVAVLVLLAIMGGLGWLLFASFRGEDSGAVAVPVIIGLIVVGIIWISLGICFALISTFMVPVMYRRRCSAWDAFIDVAKLIVANLGPFFLFGLFGIALLLGVGVAGTMIACMTCCIGALPYISTVLLLPAIVCLAAYKLLFIRQFGDGYDVWATIVAPPITEPLPPPPPAAI